MMKYFDLFVLLAVAFSLSCTNKENGASGDETIMRETLQHLELFKERLDNNPVEKERYLMLQPGRPYLVSELLDLNGFAPYLRPLTMTKRAAVGGISHFQYVDPLGNPWMVMVEGSTITAWSFGRNTSDEAGHGDDIRVQIVIE